MSSKKSMYNKGVELLLQERLTDTNYSRLYHLFSNIALNRFKWNGLPKGIESRFIENGLFFYGQVGFTDDSDLGLICLPCSDMNQFNVYGEPTNFLLHGIGYNKNFSANDIVRIINNDKIIPSMNHVNFYASKIAEIDKAIDVNLRHQKTPYIVATTKQNEFTMKNLVKKIQEDEYAIFVDERLTNGGELGISIENTQAPYIIDKLQAHKNNLVCEFLTIMGLNNTASNNNKKERLLVDEVNVNNGEILMYLDLDFKNRQKACEEINNKFGLNVSVEKVIHELHEEIQDLIPADKGGVYDGEIHN